MGQSKEKIGETLSIVSAGRWGSPERCCFKGMESGHCMMLVVQRQKLKIAYILIYKLILHGVGMSVSSTFRIVRIIIL